MMRFAQTSQSGPFDRVSVETASQLLDFRGSGVSPISEHAAQEQLKGAVAIHNVLQEEGVAYLADEVGMGKTYVALGALALFRHFNPNFRVLVIAPRENIQKKWIKELTNFCERNVQFSDLRVRAVHGAPARTTVACDSLGELVRETAVDPDRDFFARLTSFSLPLGKDSEGWKTKRDQILEHLPWLDSTLFDLRDKERFKDNFARAVNCALPVFDLVIFDEGHNIKGGFRNKVASRNRVLALAFGHQTEVEARNAGFNGYGRRARRVLFLSATPIENDYVQLWNQLDIFGHGGGRTVLRDEKATDEAKRNAATKFLIRRVTTLPVAGKQLTKNLYRREWRRGGVAEHDMALSMPDVKQRLTVALVQKKVSEVLGNTRFNNCFQIGMLASFESFLETARVTKPESSSGDTGNFDDTEQTEDEFERHGIDVSSVNNLARHYRHRFRSELPHPKMDALVTRLSSVFATGEKALVFVRRVASVKELQRKLEERYNRYLYDRLHSELRREVHAALDRLIGKFEEERIRYAGRHRARTPSEFSYEAEDLDEAALLDDTGGSETFFSWFFRGNGPDGVLSGATLQKRFSQAGSINSTFFEDNHVAWLLGVKPGEVAFALSHYLSVSTETLRSRLLERVRYRLPFVRQQQRRNLFLAYQGAALELMAEHEGSLHERAVVVREERYSTGNLVRAVKEAPNDLDWLEVETFFTDLRMREELCAQLWPCSQASQFRSGFREQELRREMLSAMMRLGHPFIDLYVLTVNRIGRLELRAREKEDESQGNLANEMLNLLERQRMEMGVNNSFRELKEAAQNFDLILAVNDPASRTESLSVAATRFGGLLRAQQPVGGMFGQINETLVRQFRMPGYPLVLITTDLLQEGEDLHTFCSSIYHYGISWMPSSMEQRVGRIDRVASQTDRRLSNRPSEPEGGELLQVYYPHLRETVEVLQVNRVLDRLNRFMRLMHEDLVSDTSDTSRLDVANGLARGEIEIGQIQHPLQTAFPVRQEFLEAPPFSLVVEASVAERLIGRFTSLPRLLEIEGIVDWDSSSEPHILFGSFRLRTRLQPFTLLLRSIAGRPLVRCVSPVGVLQKDFYYEDIGDALRGYAVRIAAVYDQKLSTYDITIEDDVLLGNPSSDKARVTWLLRRVAEAADKLEKDLLHTDQPMAVFKQDLTTEGAYGR
jgi:hypothetical protein